MVERTEFRPTPYFGLFPLGFGLFALTFGLAGLCGLIPVEVTEPGQEIILWVVSGGAALIGGLHFVGGVVLPSRRIIVDERGIVFTECFGMRERVTDWDDIERWAAAPPKLPGEQREDLWQGLYAAGVPRSMSRLFTDWPADTGRAVFVHATGRRWPPLVIHERDVWRPGFEEFLALIRGEIGAREVVIPGLTLPPGDARTDSGEGTLVRSESAPVTDIQALAGGPAGLAPGSRSSEQKTSPIRPLPGAGRTRPD